MDSVSNVETNEKNVFSMLINKFYATNNSEQKIAFTAFFYKDWFLAYAVIAW